jgi:hypothetical protein
MHVGLLAVVVELLAEPSSQLVDGAWRRAIRAYGAIS